jgi:hypothetical protein
MHSYLKVTKINVVEMHLQKIIKGTVLQDRFQKLNVDENWQILALITAAAGK